MPNATGVLEWEDKPTVKSGSDSSLAQSLNVPFGRIILTRRYLIFILGAITGFVWLLPVFGAPGSNSNPEGGDSLLRYIRLLLPMALFVFARAEAVFALLTALLIQIPRGRLRRPAVRMLVVAAALGLIPLFSGFLTGNVTFIVSAVLPLTLSFMAMLGMTLLEWPMLKVWIQGVTVSACLFLVFGMLESQFESSAYFGRPRVLLGFVHPVNTASAILAAMIFFPLSVEMHWRSLRIFWQRLYLCGYILVAFLLLLAAQSRNLLVSIVIAFVSFWIARRTTRSSRFAWFALILLLPIGLYAFVLLGSRENAVWEFVDDLASRRLSFFQTVLDSSLDLNGGRLLFAANDARLAALADYAGFASTDSVFLSFLINYGVFSFLAFLGMLLLLGYWLSQEAHDAAPLGALCGVVLFFSLDAQGVTTSNLAVFIVFAYAIRAGILAHTYTDAKFPAFSGMPPEEK